MMGNVVAGAAGGIAAQLGSRYLGSYGSPVGLGVVGYFAKNETLLTMAGMQASALLPVAGFLGGGNGGSGGAI